MANLKNIVSENTDGDFFVDTTCINCDACRKLAPDNFLNAGEHSYVSKQPETKVEELKVKQALLSCPTNSIGDISKSDLSKAQDSLPLLIEEDVYKNGFNHKASFGADSYFIQSPKGNWLIDSPKYNSTLVDKFKKFGGIDYIFLTHRDDIADSEKYMKEFSSKVIIHQDDKDAAPFANFIISKERIQIDDAQIVHVPGHTKGHMVLIWKDKYIFTGDHFCYFRTKDTFGSFKDYCWFDWKVQVESIRKMKEFQNVEYILPGHGTLKKITKGTFSKVVDDYLESL